MPQTVLYDIITDTDRRAVTRRNFNDASSANRYTEFTVYGWTQIHSCAKGLGISYCVTSNVSLCDAWKRADSIRRQIRRQSYTDRGCTEQLRSWSWDKLHFDMIR